MTIEERKEIIQEVIDRLLYNPDYIKDLIELNKKHPLTNRVNQPGIITIKNNYNGGK
jgi:hypothetical protein